MAPRHLVLMIVVAVLWGFNTVPSAIAVTYITPTWLAFTRVAITGAPVVGGLRLERRYWVPTAIYGIGTFGIQFTLFFMALRAGLPAGVAAVVAQTHVIWALVLSRAILGERTGALGWVGSAIAFAGIVLLAWPQADYRLPALGLAFSLAGAFTSAAGSVAIRKAPGVSNLALNVWGSVFAVPLLAIVAFVLEGDPRPQWANAFGSLTFVACIAFQSLVASALCFPAWTRMIARYGVSKVAPFTLLVPLFAVGSTTVVFGEQWTPRMLVGMGLVVGGLGVVQLLPIARARHRAARAALLARAGARRTRRRP